MPKMTFAEDYRKDLDARTSVNFAAGSTYDVPDELVADVTAKGAATPASETSAPTQAEGHGVD